MINIPIDRLIKLAVALAPRVSLAGLCGLHVNSLLLIALSSVSYANKMNVELEFQLF